MPITAMRSPVRSWSWSQAAEWKTFPVKDSMPAKGGSFGPLSAPAAETRTSAVSSPSVVRIVQRAAS